MRYLTPCFGLKQVSISLMLVLSPFDAYFMNSSSADLLSQIMASVLKGFRFVVCAFAIVTVDVAIIASNRNDFMRFIDYKIKVNSLLDFDRF